MVKSESYLEIYINGLEGSVVDGEEGRFGNDLFFLSGFVFFGCRKFGFIRFMLF